MKVSHVLYMCKLIYPRITYMYIYIKACWSLHSLLFGRKNRIAIYVIIQYCFLMLQYITFQNTCNDILCVVMCASPWCVYYVSSFCCIYACIQVDIHARIQHVFTCFLTVAIMVVPTYIHEVHACTYTNEAHARMHACMLLYVCSSVCLSACMFGCMIRMHDHLFMCMYLYIFMYPMYVYIYDCMFICTKCMHVYMHIYIYINIYTCTSGVRIRKLACNKL